MMECMLYDGRDSADEDGRFQEYRERIAVSDGRTMCCETHVRIPEGFPYALCEGLVSYEGKAVWDDFPQALEVWRMLRSMYFRKKACFLFGSAYDEMEMLSDIDNTGAVRLIEVRMRSVRSRIKRRYPLGKKPRLHPSERESLLSGKPVKQLPFTHLRALRGKEEED